MIKKIIPKQDKPTENVVIHTVRKADNNGDFIFFNNPAKISSSSQKISDIISTDTNKSNKQKNINVILSSPIRLLSLYLYNHNNRTPYL